jgi:Arc/MetJ family transcription regulator
MATNLAIDEELLKEAQKVGNHKTKKETVNEALKEYIQRKKQKKIIELFHTIEWDPKCNYKKERERR